MQSIVLDNISLQIPMEPLLKRLHIREGSGQVEELQVLVAEAERIGRPKAVCGVAFVDERGDDYVVLDGVRFSSRILAVNLQGTHRVFPYVATCGVELEAWADAMDDMLLSFWSEAIREAALAAASRALHECLDETFQPGKSAQMNPGSLPDWPLKEQRPMFSLLNDPEALIGVHLTGSLLMIPTKSVSGVRFATEESFASCMLCPRETCPNRRADYDPDMYNARYRQTPAQS
ncbi:MAG: vitamin B12 dependent-methionine synthase activation domain-containing protein [Anaerolineae bacterium]